MMRNLYGIFFALYMLAGALYSNEFSSEEGMMTTTETPKYLYKILSYRNWQATLARQVVAVSSEDDAFVHFSKEDQLERVLAKYWSEAPQFVVLKIDTGKLQGDLVYEENRSGSEKYYHLYRGFIPFSAIKESTITYRESPYYCNAQQLEIVQMGHPVLRQPARTLSTAEILSPEIQDLIQSMKVTMKAAPGVGLAAPQIGQPIQLVVIEDMDHSHLTLKQLMEKDRHTVPFHVMINPCLYIEDADTSAFFEGCLSVPKFLGIVPRAKSVRVECLNEHAQPVVIRAKGWYARILQHEIDHLNAVLFIDRAPLSTLMTEENYVKLWKEKTIEEVQKNFPLSSKELTNSR
ncbi:MAG: peptide deformylase [Simkania sp.]|nr:peptide deformylase [Simkania sp.]